MSYVVANRVFVKQQYTEEFEPRDFEASITTSPQKGDRYPKIRHTGESRHDEVFSWGWRNGTA
jgi:hypothetical protein